MYLRLFIYYPRVFTRVVNAGVFVQWVRANLIVELPVLHRSVPKRFGNQFVRKNAFALRLEMLRAEFQHSELLCVPWCGSVHLSICCHM